MIVADECLNGKLIAALEQAGYELTAISRTAGGIDDLRVLQTAERLNAVLITEDSDFGEWVLPIISPTSRLFFFGTTKVTTR